MTLHKNANQRVATEGHPYKCDGAFKILRDRPTLQLQPPCQSKEAKSQRGFACDTFEVPNGRSIGGFFWRCVSD